MSGRAGACAHAIFDSQGSRRTAEHEQFVPIRADPSRGTNSGRHGPHASSRCTTPGTGIALSSTDPYVPCKKVKLITKQPRGHRAAVIALRGSGEPRDGDGGWVPSLFAAPWALGARARAPKSRSRSPGLSPVSIGPGASNLLEQFLIKGICLCQRCLIVGTVPLSPQSRPWA